MEPKEPEQNPMVGSEYLEGILKGRLDYLIAQPSIRLPDLKLDDVIWWITKNGGRYYHIIKVPYERGADGNVKEGAGKGLIKGLTSSGEAIETDNGGIHGSSLGGKGLLRVWYISKNASIEFLIFPKNPGERAKTIITSPVASMGIIRAEQYKNA